MNAVLAVTFGYLVGSIPFAFLLSRHRGIDLRRAGSGNIGASNVLRTAGVRAAVYPVWLRFRGGKGVATAAGAFAVLAPEALGIALCVFLIAVVATRFISVGSIAGALTLALVAILSDAPGIIAIGAAASALVIIYRHRENLARLVAGTERRIGQRVVNGSVQ